MIKVECPGCGAKLKGPEGSEGKRIKCPKCGAAVTIPAASPDQDLPPEGAFDLDPLPAAPPVAAAPRVAVEEKPRKLKGSSGKSSKKRAVGGEEMGAGDWVVAILCAGIGVIAGIVWMIQGKPKGKVMFAVSLGMVVFWNVVRFALISSQKPVP